MAQVRSLDSSDRLPWLADTSRPQPRQSRRSWYPLAVAASVAGAIAYGGWTLVEPITSPEPAPIPTARTVPLPPAGLASPAAAEPEAPSVAEREALRPTAEPAATRLGASKRAKAAEPGRPAAVRPERARNRAVRAPAAAAPAYEPRAWNSGVRGRVIQLGAFRTSAQAQTEWRRVYSRYPLLRPLSPRVLKTTIRGKTFYRLQLGTFSHAHSELLCQRLRNLGEGCMVLGLPKRGRGR